MSGDIEKAKKLVSGSKKILVFTGAGISTGSGIPDYRGPGGAWIKVSVGSSLSVEPAASVPLAAKAGGRPYIIVNRGPTAHDKAADIKLDGDACELLPGLFSG